MLETYQVNPIKIHEAEQFRQGIIDLDNGAYDSYKSLKQQKLISVDYKVYIGMSKNADLVACVKELYRQYSAEYPLTEWTLADQYCKLRDDSKKDQDLENRDWNWWPWKYNICYQKWEYIAIWTRVIPKEAKKGCWRYGMSLSKKDDEIFYQFCINTMPVSK